MEHNTSAFPGDLKISASFKVYRSQPFDDRSVVSSVEDLPRVHHPYNGMVCSIAGTGKLMILALPTPEDVEAYMYADPETYEGMMFRAQFWKEVSGTADLSGVTVAVDTELNRDSENPVANQTLTEKFGGIEERIREIEENGIPTDGSGYPGSVPVFTSEEKAQVAKEYILTQPFSSTEGVTNTYISNLMTAVRTLQAQVAQLQNAFRYGINSYNGTDTAIARQQAELDDVIPEEPVSAVEEDMLAMITSITSNRLDKEHSFMPSAAVLVGEDTLTFNGTASWTDPEEVLRDIEEPKQFTYLTLTGHDVEFTFSSVDTKEEAFRVSLDSATNRDDSHYNIMCIVSKKVAVPETSEECGDNYVWFQVSSRITGVTYAAGYYNVSTGLIQDTPSYFSNKVYLSEIAVRPGQVLSKFNLYKRFQDFSDKVVPSQPEEEDYKLRAAHITIRSVKSSEVLTDEKLVSKLQDNELIFVESDRTLRIKSKNKIYVINGGGAGNLFDDNENTTMTFEELKEALEKFGIITVSGDEDTGCVIQMNPVQDITFINSDTNLRYKMYVDADGHMQVDPENCETLETLAEKIKPGYALRLFPDALENEQYQYKNGERVMAAAQGGEQPVKYAALRTIIAETLSSGNHCKTSDLGQQGDRLRISAFYAPLESETSFRCSHGFVELENTSDYDIPVNGCYLHMAKWENGGYREYHCALKGTVPAGGTYVIRGKQHAKLDDDNVYIKVDSYDVEWINTVDGQRVLMDFTLKLDPDTAGATGATVLCLTYGLPELSAATEMIRQDSGTVTYTYYEGKDNITFTAGAKDSKNNYVITNRRYIDSCIISMAGMERKNSQCKWACAGMTELIMKPNTMFRMMFGLDPAKQGYTGFTMNDSSRARWAKASDLQILTLNEYIEFPKSDEKRAVSYYTPRASYLHKNVITDKTDIDKTRPNAVTVSFGIDVYTTRCFNWVSAGSFNEYVWIRQKGTDVWSKAFPSYTKLSVGDVAPSYSAAGITRKEFVTVSDGAIVDADVNNLVYARINSVFPGSGDSYTVHKCILTGFSATTAPVEYEYVVGRAELTDANTPDAEHISKVMRFTVYPSDYEARVYQITDQQGFHWVEYQVWAAAAKELNKLIATEMSTAAKEFPLLINTGDMTQSGARVNEWLDYYNAGECLFDHLEQMNIIGNNDLCGPDHTLLGTGNDPGKSNPFYHRVFYCYEIPFTTVESSPEFKWNKSLICNGEYLTSIYYIKTVGMFYLFLNSEYTYKSCEADGLLKIAKDASSVWNVYTGISVGGTKAVAAEYKYPDETEDNPVHYGPGEFTPVYNTVYHWLDNNANEKPSGWSRPVIMACHEIPFTVITNASLNESKFAFTRTYPTNASKPSDSLGCHMNQLSPFDTVGTYWISRLLEHFNCKLCIGGHKHTYALSQPIAEYYFYEGGTKNSLDNGPKAMHYSLKDEVANPITWSVTDKRYYNTYNASGETTSEDTVTVSTTKVPLIALDDTDGATTAAINQKITSLKANLQMGPCTLVSNNESSIWTTQSDKFAAAKSRAVTYFMCQATGYKVVSNKELPTKYQLFSYIIPETSNTFNATNSSYSDTVNKNQLYPMFGRILVEKEVTGEPSKYHVYLGRIANIGQTAAKAYNFGQNTYETVPVQFQYMRPDSAESGFATQYGEWVTCNAGDAPVELCEIDNCPQQVV